MYKAFRKLKLKCGIGGELYEYPGLPETQASGSLSNLSLKHRWRQKWQNGSCPALGAPSEGRFFGKDSNAGKTEGRRKREQPKMRWTDSMKGALGLRS